MYIEMMTMRCDTLVSRLYLTRLASPSFARMDGWINGCTAPPAVGGDDDAVVTGELICTEVALKEARDCRHRELHRKREECRKLTELSRTRWMDNKDMPVESLNKWMRRRMTGNN